MTDNRTEELRRMLDERGVEWTKPKSATEFIQTTFLRNGWGIEVLERSIGLCVTATNIFDTPEQAIAATLGGGKLTAEQMRETVEKHWHDLPADYDMPEAAALPEYSYDWHAIADELNATLGEVDEGCYLVRDGKKFPVELDCGFVGIMPIAITVAGFRYLLEVPNGE
jgi:hypothetical protein